MPASSPAAFKGLCAFPLTPADADGVVDTAALRRLLAPLPDAGLGSICVLGSTGTYAYLTRAQRRRAVAAAVQECAGRTPVLAGIGALRTDAAVSLGLDAKQEGASGVLLAPMSYARLTDEEVFVHFEAVSRAVGLPMCIYNNPGTTGFTFTPALVARLARLEHVVALKTPAPGHGAQAEHAAWRHAADADFSVGYSVDWHAADALLAGGDAWYSVAAGLFPQACAGLAAAARAGDAARARALNARLQPLWDLFTAHSSLRVMYAAARALGLMDADPPRPILPLSEDLQIQVASVAASLA